MRMAQKPLSTTEKELKAIRVFYDDGTARDFRKGIVLGWENPLNDDDGLHMQPCNVDNKEIYALSKSLYKSVREIQAMDEIKEALESFIDALEGGKFDE